MAGESELRSQRVHNKSVLIYISGCETKNGKVLPTRGSIHDIGYTLTHKKIIIDKLFLRHKTVQQTSRETFHSIPAIQRYISAFRQVLLCRQKNRSLALDMIPGLVRKYEKIVDAAGQMSLFYFIQKIHSKIGNASLEKTKRPFLRQIIN